MKYSLKKASPVAEAFSKLLYPFAEVVIHDLEEDKIQAIYNSFSNRNVGDESYLDRWDFTADPKENVIGPYEKMNYDGRKLKSISIVIRDDSDAPVGFLCINMDISIFDKQHSLLSTFLNNNDQEITKEKQCLFKDDLYEQINSFIQNYCKENSINIEAITRKNKQSLIIELKDKGAFNAKNSATYIARILNISRATVYNYLNKGE